MASEGVPPSYLVRSQELKNLFANLSTDDFLICNYACLFKRDANWLRCRLFVTKKCIFIAAAGRVRQQLSWSDVADISKDEVRIKIKANNEDHLLGEFVSCSVYILTFDVLTEIWSRIQQERLKDLNDPELKEFINLFYQHEQIDDDNWKENSEDFPEDYHYRCNELKTVVPDLPNDELFIIDFACAYKEGFLRQGRIYATSENLYFSSSFLNRTLKMPWSDILEIEPIFTAWFIANGIKITTGAAQYYLGTFHQRDLTLGIFRDIWNNHNSPICKPLSSWIVAGQNLEKFIHEQYQSQLSSGTKRALIITGATVGTTVVAAAAAPLVAAGLLGAVGFGGTGVVAGSIAAAWQSAIGSVAAGSFFAACQSAGAAGISAGTAMLIGAGTGAAAAATAAAATAREDGGANEQKPTHDNEQREDQGRAHD